MDKADLEGDTSHGTKDRIYEVATQYLIHGDKAADILGIKPQTLNRYLRRAKGLGVDVERGKILRDIESNYSR